MAGNNTHSSKVSGGSTNRSQRFYILDLLEFERLILLCPSNAFLEQPHLHPQGWYSSNIYLGPKAPPAVMHAGVNEVPADSSARKVSMDIHIISESYRSSNQQLIFTASRAIFLRQVPHHGNFHRNHSVLPQSENANPGSEHNLHSPHVQTRIPKSTCSQVPKAQHAQNACAKCSQLVGSCGAMEQRPWMAPVVWLRCSEKIMFF